MKWCPDCQKLYSEVYFELCPCKENTMGQVKRDLKCPNCGENNHWEGPAEEKWVHRVRCICGTIIQVETEEEVKNGGINEGLIHVNLGFANLEVLPCFRTLVSNQSTYINSFCLGCKAVGLSANSTIHMPDCKGVIVLVHQKYDLVKNIEQTSKNEDQAISQVNAEIEKLQTDETYLEQQRAKYSGLMTHWNEAQKKSGK